ncbi:putative signal transduction protein with EAL and GGDEF domain [Streptomyces sp. B3I7]|uniref:putative bifunctional diguanylate cyclase/phosphodiesterase n=1 Tax=Streptomyces sp. B3I7 TaxID=3042269 RepID=UPI00277EE307|nr:bifunctional diguanylate cyclase/phosphodiesterase [Streptomyces sp. B3I7]MDQ0813263.1 putative signal transduction protein with EAL and GGDEF domain [Streptomyces sp. B3I7]
MSGTSEVPAPAADTGRTGVTDCDDGGSAAAFAEAPLAMAVVDREGRVVTANRALVALLGRASSDARAGSDDGPRTGRRTDAASGDGTGDRAGDRTDARAGDATDAGRPAGRAGAGAGLTGRAAADLVDLGSDARIRHTYLEVLRGRQSRLRCTRRLKHPDGHSLWVQVTVSPLPPARRAVLLSVTDISARRELQARMRHLQIHDPVTRLPNRTLFFERLTAALDAEAYEGGGAGGTGRIGLCYLDLDGFKAVNDTLGHRLGDRLLAAVAERLTRCAAEAARGRPGADRAADDRAGDDTDADDGVRAESAWAEAGRAAGTPLVARLGGDEFALLVEDSTGTDQLAELAESALDALRAPFELADRRVSVSASIGVVERRTAGTTATALMQDADTTLYWAKADGRARWTLFDPERNAHRMTRQALSSTLRPGIEQGEFALEYQPLVSMTDGRVRGVEALVRWHHPQFGALAPNRFISLAEEDGSIVQLGRWVLNTACRQARRWQLDHPDAPPLFVSVNVAVRQIWDSDLVADVAHTLAETGLPPHLLQLELTESALTGSAGRPLEALEALSDMGVRIAIDDFGTGYSNLAYLSRLPVNVLKLDGSFVRGFQYEAPGAGIGTEAGTGAPDPGAGPGEPAASPADEVIVEAMVQLAHRLGLTVIAECVETSAQAARLRAIGCDTGQGWLYSRPVPPDRISALLTTTAAAGAPPAGGNT